MKFQNLAFLEVARVTSLSRGPVQRHVTFDPNAFTQVAGFDALRTNGCGYASDFLMCGANHEDAALLSSRVWLHDGFGVRFLNCFCPVPPGNFANRPNLFEFAETALRISPKFLNGFAVIYSCLPLNLGERAALQPRLLFQHTQSIARFHARDLPGVAAEYDP